jgi:HPt (histidine-containing phosphotransfer) domain-containing protein
LSVIDEGHLGRMTLGDRGLEREVLEIFVRQTSIMLDRIEADRPATAAVAAHTLKGSARGVGAWRVAHAAEQLERAVERGAGRDLERAIAALEAVALEANTAIGARLRDLRDRVPNR